MAPEFEPSNCFIGLSKPALFLGNSWFGFNNYRFVKTAKIKKFSYPFDEKFLKGPGSSKESFEGKESNKQVDIDLAVKRGIYLLEKQQSQLERNQNAFEKKMSAQTANL